ncbi:MAG TPA: hypothetical protein VF941_02255 [Clostridia bacterium]
MKTWWTCPKCKSYKMVDENKSCVRCPGCGRFFDKMNNELDVNRSMYTMVPDGTKCDLN